MDIKISKLARLTMPVLATALLAACGSDDDTTPGGGGVIDGLHPAGENEVVIYYKRDEAHAKVDESAYEGWGLHLWNGEGCTSTDLAGMGIADGGTDWASPMMATGISETYGAYYVLKVDAGASDPHECMNFILHSGDDRGFGSSNLKVELTKLDADKGIFGFHGSSELFYAPIAERPVAIDGAKAHWVDAGTIAWESAGSATQLELRYDPANGIEMDPDTKEVTGGTAVALSAGTLTDDAKARFPHLSGLSAAAIEVDDATLKAILKSQIVVVAMDAEGVATAATQVQKPGVIDEVFVKGDGGALAAELGAVVSGDDVSFKVWAPTAQSVKLYMYNEDMTSAGEAVTMTEAANGVWSADQSGVVGKYYRYEVTVYHPTTKKIETRMVTDPYSLALSTNSLYSLVVDLDATELKPADWDNYTRPEMAEDVDHVLYESHLRDFSVSDTQGTAANNGKYLALTESERESVTHLQALKDAGLTTLHILPAFDIATVDEKNAIDIDAPLADLCAAIEKTDDYCASASGTIEAKLESFDPTTGDAQSLMNDLRGLDSFNWGYDPFHYTVPEGSYASDAEGTTRILEFREMVRATHGMGLKIVMDVVYNHTNASGVNDKSVLDKIVPGYYHRRDANTGGVEQSTCCDNTATENLMMGKLMTDSLVTWSEAYKVDGFRFDLMGHQPKDLMVDSLEAVRAVDPDTLFYGEGWDFGEVANNARFEQATQWNMAGTEIGTFSDRLRDAVRGGSPFDSGEGIRKTQGFGNADTLNELITDEDSYRTEALHNQDLIRVGMAGNLQKFVLLDSEGKTKRGQDVNYNGAKAGYTLNPSENISYVSKHDNQTLWDNNAYKATTGTTSADRSRMQTVSLSTVMFGQGIPFVHMGSELLRSKSMQRDSYDSGDWFNRVRFDGSDNNWNVGLPRADKDGDNWDLIKTIIADDSTKPSKDDIALAKAQFLEMLTIRSSSDLFRLTTAEEVQARVDFRNVGAEQVQGLIVMSIDNGTGAGKDLDANNDAIVVVLNATDEEQEFEVTGATGFELHEVQQASADSVVMGASFTGASFTVPARTTAVFVQPRDGARGTGLRVDTSNKDLSAIPPLGDLQIYVRGLDDAGWGTDFELVFSKDGKYEFTKTLDAGTYGFKVADADWSDATSFGNDEAEVTLGTSKAIIAGQGNLSITLEDKSVVKFVTDFSDIDAPTLMVTSEIVASCGLLEDSADAGPLASELAVRGSHSDWAWNASYALSYKGNNTYQVSLGAGSYEFKLAADSESWDPQMIAYADDARVENLVMNVDYQAWARVGDSAIGDPGNNKITLAGDSVLTLTVNGELSDNVDNGTISICEVE
ncbi:pullulanase-type alpha-1,6-glucosidase [Agarivorans sp. 1_MG-2023]|uniref:pullulanase-type alpha-1,6-glucosidase n=1 Tax=Agarivorans sp. 1_MG-2023 TaxID=3062634 RepID=UPI0026E2CD4D|nr:pullulanase-type alpha-1,6-glucosidase [Agarivorans sp. 1_MG-2023]MDO6762735.1 pullulanase-type alpha-1,6-glucosidase [Agarivorans sp. 1_MG-2023]